MIALILDCETSGLVENHSIKLTAQPEIIEFCSFATNLETGERLQELEMLIQPKNPISAKITEITGIDNEGLKYAPPFKDFAEAIKINLETALAIIAHNMSFDAEMLDIEFERLGTKIVWPRRVCTVENTLYLKGYRLKQSELYSLIFPGESYKAHRGRSDVEALERICLELFKRGEL